MFVYAHLCITLNNHTASVTRVKRHAEIIAGDFQLEQLLQRRAAWGEILPENFAREGYNPTRL
jgi:hypothetical protein